jgi:hypothetical protein
MEQPDKLARPSFWLILYRKGRKEAERMGNFVFLLLFYLILGKSKIYCTFSTDIDNDSFVSKAQMPSKRINYCTRGPNFFLSIRIFPPNWPDKSAESWQLWSAERQ